MVYACDLTKDQEKWVGLNGISLESMLIYIYHGDLMGLNGIYNLLGGATGVGYMGTSITGTAPPSTGRVFPPQNGFMFAEKRARCGPFPTCRTVIRVIWSPTWRFQSGPTLNSGTSLNACTSLRVLILMIQRPWISCGKLVLWRFELVQHGPFQESEHQNTLEPTI